MRRMATAAIPSTLLVRSRPPIPPSRLKNLEAPPLQWSSPPPSACFVLAMHVAPAFAACLDCGIGFACIHHVTSVCGAVAVSRHTSVLGRWARSHRTSPNIEASDLGGSLRRSAGRPTPGYIIHHAAMALCTHAQCAVLALHDRLSGRRWRELPAPHDAWWPYTSMRCMHTRTHIVFRCCPSLLL